MADNTFLQAFQTGASLYDKAQSRKMEQAQMENNFRQGAAQLLIQQQTADLNSKVQNVKLLEANIDLGIKQQQVNAYSTELPDVKKYADSFSKYMADPENSPFPAAPLVTHPELFKQVQQMNSEAVKFGPAAVKMKQLEKNQLLQSQYDIDALKHANTMFSETGINSVVTDPKTGVPTIDQDKFKEAQKKKEASDLQKRVTGAAGNMADIQKMIDSGQITPEFGQKLLDAAEANKSYTERNIDTAVNAAIAKAKLDGKPMDEHDIADYKDVLARNGGRLQAVPAKILTDTNAKIGVSEAASRVVNSISDWEKKWSRPFDENLGYFIKNVNALQTELVNEKDPSKREAIDILSTFAKTRNGSLKTESGATVTPQEEERLSQAIGKASDKNTVIRLSAFARNSKIEAANDILRTKEFNWPIAFRKFARGDSPATPAATPSEGISVPLNGGTFIIKKKQ